MRTHLSETNSAVPLSPPCFLIQDTLLLANGTQRSLTLASIFHSCSAPLSAQAACAAWPLPVWEAEPAGAVVLGPMGTVATVYLSWHSSLGVT